MSVLLVGCFHSNVPTLDIPADKTSPATDENSLLSATATDLTEALNQEFRDAQSLAKVWRADAVLHAHTVTYAPGLARGQSKRVYVFGSPTAPTDWWTVTINERSGERVRAIIPREDYLGPTVPPVPLEFWSLNNVAALQIADKNGGGKEFREKNPGAEVTASLMRGGPKNWLWWIVTYRGLDGQSLSVRIHPTSGVIYSEDGQPIEINSPTPTPTPTAS